MHFLIFIWDGLEYWDEVYEPFPYDPEERLFHFTQWFEIKEYEIYRHG